MGSEMNKKIAFFVIGLILLLKFVLLFSTGGLFGIVSYTTWMIWLSLILVIVFMWFFYSFVFKALYSLKFLIIFIIIIAIVIFAIGLPTKAIKFGKTSSNSSTTVSPTSSSDTADLIDCTSTASAQPAKYPGWKTTLYSAPLSEDSVNDNVSDNGVRSFSLKALKAQTSPSSVYYHIEKTDGSFATGAKSQIEVCDSNNKTPNYSTTSTANIDPASANSLGVYIYLHSRGYITAIPGNYRIDGFLYVDGAWHLTDRFSSVALTE